LIGTDQGLFFAKISDNKIELQEEVLQKGKNVSSVAEGLKKELAVGLYDEGLVKVVTKDFQDSFEIELNHPLDINFVNSKLILRNDEAIWIADPITKQVQKIVDAGNCFKNFDRVFIEI
jgi:hypothetical protein